MSADEILGGTTVLPSSRVLAIDAAAPAAAAAPPATADEDEEMDDVPVNQNLVSDSQRPLEVQPLTAKDMYSKLQDIRKSTESKKVFVTAQVIDIAKLHRPPGSTNATTPSGQKP